MSLWSHSEQRRAKTRVVMKQDITPEAYDSIQWMGECADRRPYDKNILFMGNKKSTIKQIVQIITNEST